MGATLSRGSDAARRGTRTTREWSFGVRRPAGCFGSGAGAWRPEQQKRAAGSARSASAVGAPTAAGASRRRAGRSFRRRRGCGAHALTSTEYTEARDLLVRTALGEQNEDLLLARRELQAGRAAPLSAPRSRRRARRGPLGRVAARTSAAAGGLSRRQVGRAGSGAARSTRSPLAGKRSDDAAGPPAAPVTRSSSARVTSSGRPPAATPTPRLATSS